jgi:Tol biopolymer transport system component
LTNTPEYEFTPQWSPDNKQILFQRTVRGSEFETYVMDADGSHVQRLTTVSMFLQNPVWRS